MKAAGSARDLLIFLCVAAALLVVVGASGAALVSKLLVPEWFFFVLVVVAVVATRKDTCGLPRFSSSPYPPSTVTKLKSPSDYRGTAIARAPCYAFIRGKNVNQIDPAQASYGFRVGRIFGPGSWNES
jgi:hypothetical protein